MGIADEINNSPEPQATSRVCTLCGYLPDMSQEDREAVQTGKIGAERLALILTRNGFPVSESSVKRHRTKGHTA